MYPNYSFNHFSGSPLISLISIPLLKDAVIDLIGCLSTSPLLFFQNAIITALTFHASLWLLPVSVPLSKIVVNLKKNTQCESCKLCFIGDRMKTATLGTALWITLKSRVIRSTVPYWDCSKEAMGKISIYVVLWRGIHTIKHIFFYRNFLLVKHFLVKHSAN